MYNNSVKSDEGQLFLLGLFTIGSCLCYKNIPEFYHQKEVYLWENGYSRLQDELVE